jgi:hypothetical protein
MQDKPKQRSTEAYGLGQSGYTAGRNEGDPSLGIEGRNISFPKSSEPLSDLLEIDDERFNGHGGPPWAPDEGAKGTAKE